ncbi:hypothetical protein HGRIS_009128 [Hohenbuehelia grisea]|uniref:DUF6533 domain-containing protein n=1 Tax=Hohenbuehelia grisea TaxID=104357 RepID=A0ABR3J0C6_9AGAR
MSSSSPNIPLVGSGLIRHFYSYNIYDHLLTLSDELQYIWYSPWSIPKVLFFFTRYLPFATLVMSRDFLPQISPQLCNKLDKASTLLLPINIGIAEIIMSYRVWALWGRPASLGIALALIFTALAIVSGTSTLKYMPTRAYYVAHGVPGMSNCLITTTTKGNSTSFAFLVAYEALTFGLTIAKGFRCAVFRPFRMRSPASSIMQTMITDGVIYFATLLSLSSQPFCS